MEDVRSARLGCTVLVAAVPCRSAGSSELPSASRWRVVAGHVPPAGRRVLYQCDRGRPGRGAVRQCAAGRTPAPPPRRRSRYPTSLKPTTAGSVTSWIELAACAGQSWIMPEVPVERETVHGHHVETIEQRPRSRPCARTNCGSIGLTSRRAPAAGSAFSACDRRAPTAASPSRRRPRHSGSFFEVPVGLVVRLVPDHRRFKHRPFLRQPPGRAG